MLAIWSIVHPRPLRLFHPVFVLLPYKTAVEVLDPTPRRRLDVGVGKLSSRWRIDLFPVRKDHHGKTIAIKAPSQQAFVVFIPFPRIGLHRRKQEHGEESHAGGDRQEY
jgi:hypothetical protein